MWDAEWFDLCARLAPLAGLPAYALVGPAYPLTKEAEDYLALSGGELLYADWFRNEQKA
jgi:hypothetical protein